MKDRPLMKAGHASPLDDEYDVLPSIPVQTEEAFLELEGMIKNPALAKKMPTV